MARIKLESLDYSTLDIARMEKKRKVFKCPPTYRLQDDCGNGCAGDPPGYPTYFTRDVYTQYGNTPRRGAHRVITVPSLKVSFVFACDDSGYDQEKWEALMRSYWLPLPEEHPRVQAWIASTYSHHRNMYRDREQRVEKASGNPEYNAFVWENDSLPYYRLRSFTDDPRFPEEWRTREREAVRKHNEELNAIARELATPENHSAVCIVRRYYPEHAPRLDYIAAPPPNPGNWWERLAECPTPENCPGQYDMKHPCNGSWCQMCGWRKSDDEHGHGCLCSDCYPQGNQE